MILRGGIRARIAKADKSLIDHRTPEYLRAGERADPLHQFRGKLATAIDHRGDAVAPELAHRRVGGDAPTTPREFHVPVMRVAKPFRGREIGGTPAHRFSVVLG